MSKGFAEWKTKKGQDEQPQRGSTLSFEEYKAAREKGMTEDSIVQTYHPPERMTGKQRAAWNADVIGNNKLAAIAGRGTDGYLRQLENEDWNSRTYDRSYRQGLGQQIQEADRLLGTLKEGSTAYNNTKQYADYLRALQGAFTDREAYFSQFQNEDEYKLVKGVQAAQARALQNGESYNDYYQRAARGAERANQAYQAALQRKEQMQQDVNNQRRFFASTGILQVDGQILRGKAAEDYLQQMQDKVNSFDSDPEIQQLARDVQRTQQVASYAEAGRYADLKYRDDFQAKVAAGMTAFQQDKANREAGNMSDSEIARAAAWGAGDPSGLGGLGTAAILKGRQDTSALEPGEGWSEEDLNEFFYLYATNPTEAGERALSLNARDRAQRYAEQAKGVEDWTNQSGWNRLAAWGAGVVSSPANLADYYARAMEYGIHGYVMPHDQMTPADYANTMSAAAARYLNETYTLPENMPVLGGKGLGDAFSLTQSIAQSAATALLGGGATNLLFFGSAANQTFADAKGRGATDGQALALGFLSGTAEVLGETLSVEKLIHLKDPASVRQLIGNLLAQSGFEASEEAFTTVMNTMSDAIVMGDKSELQQAIRDYMAQGMSQAEAEKRAWNDWTEGVLFDAFGGFLSGGISAGGKMGISSAIHSGGAYSGGIQTRGMTKEERQELRRYTAQEIINYGKLADEGTKARSMADKAQARLDKKGSITNRQAARLQAQTSADISAADRPALLRAAEARLRDQSTSKLTSGEYKRMAQDVVDGVLDGKDGKFATALEQNVYEEMRMQIAGETVRTGNWLDDAGLKLTEARNAATKRMKMVETKDGEKAEVKSATMKNGELQLTIEQDGETKPVDLKDLKLDQYQMRALKTLTDTLGDDAAAAYNLMSGTGLQYGRASSIASYATAFGIIRDTFGRSADTEKAEAAALASSLRKGLTDEQVRYAVAIGQKRAKENGTLITREKSVWGTGKVTMDGGTLNDGTVLQGVKNKAQVLRSRQYAAVKAVAKALGIDVVLFESRADKDGNLTGAQGAYQDGVIYLDWNAGMNNIQATSERMLLRTMSHELTHFLQQNASEDYEKLKNYVTSYLAEKMGENYRKLVMEKMANQPGLSYDGAIDEVVADSCETMLRDSQYVQKMIQEDRSFGQRIWDWVKSFFRKIEASDTGAKYMQATIDELREIWDSAMKNAVESRTDTETGVAEMKAEVLQSNAEALTEIDPTEEAATATMPDGQQYSIRSMKHDIAEGKMFEDLARYTDMSREETQELRKNLERLTDIIALNRDILDLNESFGKDNRPFKPYKPNSDPLYTLSLDFSTLCRKRLMTQYVIERLQTELTDSQTGKRGRPLTAEEQLAVRDLMKEYAQQEKALKVACAMCYVEAARLKAPGQIQRFMRDPTEPMRRYFALRNKDFNASVREAQADFKEQHGYARDAKKADMKPADRNALNKLSDRLRSEYRLTAEEQVELDLAKTLPNETYLTAANLARLAEEHPVIYDAYTATIRSATRSKSLEADIPYYYGDSNRVVSDDFIAAVNRENGMRFSSWSDFQIQHMLDMMTAVIELSTRHCAMHGYTKFLEQVRIFGRTGMMFNMSGVANGTGLKADGSLDFSPTESVLVFGQDGEYDAIQAREDFPETAGLQCIGISTEHIQALLDSDIIDYIIPYHTSGLNATLRRMAQISNWKDFTAFQNAKQDPSIKFDPSIHDRETWHKEPVFSEFFNAAKQESNGYRAGEKGIVTMRRAADLYKQMCRERGMMPKFSWGNSKVDADFSNDPNYWKLLIDRKMINQKTGALIEQKPVRPDFDFKLIEQMVQEAVDAYDPTLQDRALNYVREHLDELPQRIADLKKAGAVKKATSKTNKAAKTLQAGPVAAVSEGNAAPQMSVRKAAPVQPSDGSWQRGHTEEWFRQNGFPIYSDVPEAQREANEDAESKAQEERDKRDGGHGTQIEGTEDTYRKLFESIKKQFPDRWQNMRILDASSGLGYGTRAGREMGFKNITDIEPFWNRKKYDAGKGVGTRPDYEDYSYLQDLIDSGEVEPFDFIISNAVLNVVPQDTRDDLAVAMGQMLKPGGQMFVNVISKDYEGAVKSTPEVQTKTLKSGKVVNIGAVRTMEGDYSKGGNMNGRGHETFVWKSNSVQKVFSYPELAGYLRDALGPGYTFEKAPLGMTGVMAKKSAEAAQRMPQLSARKSWNSMTDAEREQAVIENRAFNESQTRTGSPLVTLKGSPISRGGTLEGIRYPVGKVIGGRLYIHKSYADTIGDIDPKFREILINAEQALQNEYPDFQYNCLNYHPASGEIQFQEAPDFDTAREPVVGMQINVQADGTVTEANRGKPFQQIWHHKWQWVGNDYTGFNVRESWQWSKEWLSTILGASKGGSMRAWNEQLAENGLPEDTGTTTGGKVQMSVRDREYMDAVERGDMDAAQRMVDEAAKAAGYTVKAFHGTRSFGFTVFDPSRADDGISLFATSNRRTAETYSGETNRNRIQDRETKNADDLHGEQLIEEARNHKKRYQDYILMSDKDKTTIREDAKNSIGWSIRRAQEFVRDHRDAFDSDKAYIMDRLISSLYHLRDSETEADISEAWTEWEDALWDLKGMDDSIAVEFLEDVDSRGLFQSKNELDDMTYQGDMYADWYVGGPDYIFDNQLQIELNAEYHKGIYELWCKPGRQLVIDSNGENWNQITPPKELQDYGLYGPQRTRDIATAAKALGYDSVLLRDLRDNGGETAYNGLSDVYIFFDANALKSADPVTFDDGDEVIPLSQRFNVDEDDIRYSMRGGTKTDTQLLRDLYDRIEAKVEARAERNEAGLAKGYQRMLRDKQWAIENLKDEQRKALEKFHELSERYYEKEREVNAALQDLDRLVQHSGDRKQIQAQRAKVSAKEEQMAKALERLTQAKGGSEIQDILRKEREIQMQRTQDRIRDSIDRRDLRQRISKLWKDLNQKVTNPSEKKRIPVELMQQTLDVLEAINMDTSREGSKAGEKLREKLSSLRARYEELKNDPDFRKAAVYDAQVAEYLTNMIAQVGDTPINKMSVAQLETVYSTLQAMVYTASRALKLKLGEQEVEAYEVSKAMTKETRSVEKPKTGFLSTWLNAQLSPERMFNRLGGYSKDSYWGKVYGMLNEGQLKQTRLQMEGSLIFEDLMEKENEKNFRKLLDPKNTVDIGLKDENGEPVLITHGMMISLYMHLQNDQNIRHIAYGGLTIPALQDYYNGKKVRGNERATRVGGALQEIAEINDRLHETEDADEIAELEQQRDEAALRAMDFVEGLREEIDKQLTDYDRQWIAASKELFDGFSKRELNQTTLEVYGIKRANVENYYPIWVDGDFLNTPFETVAKDLSLENAGFMKERIDSSKPIRLADVTDVTSSQIRKVAQYCGLMPAIRGFNKVWGKTQTGYRDSLQKAVHETFGQAGVKYVENLMADLNGARGGQDSALGEFLNRMRGHMAQASLTMSLRVAMGQTASYPTAAAVVGWGPLMKALAHGGRNNTIISRADQELIRKWSPLLYYRMKGYSTTELGDIAGMNDKFSRLWKKARWLTGWIQAMDGATVGRLWYAAEYYVQDHNKALVKGTDAYYEAVAKVFNDIVEKTQPDYTTMQRPDILRSPNALVKQLTMFLTQRLQNFNILYDAAATYSKYKADSKAGRNGVTTEDVRQAGIATRRAVISQLAAAATITAFKFLADAILHSLKNYRDDDDELTKQSVSLELLDMFMDSLAGNVLGGGEIYDLIESKVFGKTYYGIEVSGLATVTDLVDAFSSAFDHALKGELSLKDADKLARNLATVAGIPYANAKKFVQAGIWYAQDVRNGEWLWESNAGIDRSTGQQASRLYRAYTNGDGAKVKQILAEVPEDKQKDVYSAVRKLIREQQKSGELNVYEAMRQMKNYGGSTDQIMAEYIKDLYEAGALPKADAEKYLQEYAGKTKEAAAKTVTNVDGKQASGVNYNDIDDLFKIGRMNAEEARKALVNYGIDKDTADMKVEYWSYQQKNPGTAMTTEDRFETYWKKYRPVGMTPAMYDGFYVDWNAVQGTDKNHDGKADSGSKKAERIAIIDSLPLSREQKDALFNMEWKTGLQDAPWNK